MKPFPKPKTISACDAVLLHQCSDAIVDALSQADIKPTCQSIIGEFHTLISCSLAIESDWRLDDLSTCISIQSKTLIIYELFHSEPLW